MFVRLVRQAPRIRVIPVRVRAELRTCNQDALEMESAIPDIEDQVRDVLFLHAFRALAAHCRGCAAEDFAGAERIRAREDGVVAGLFEAGDDGMEGVVELDGADKGDAFSGLEVALDGCEEVQRIDANGDEDVHDLQAILSRRFNWNEAAMSVMHEQITS